MRSRVLMFAAVLSTGAAAVLVAQNVERLRVILRGYEEVPAISTVGYGTFEARIDEHETEIRYRLSYANLEGNVLQAHIHLGQRRVNGGISVFLCSNVGGPPGTPPCPPSPATVSGTITAEDVIGPTNQGIAPTELAELIRAIRAGVTYANVHSSKFPGGEIRAQLTKDDDRHKHSDKDSDKDSDDDSDDR